MGSCCASPDGDEEEAGSRRRAQAFNGFLLALVIGSGALLCYKLLFAETFEFEPVDGIAFGVGASVGFILGCILPAM